MSLNNEAARMPSSDREDAMSPIKPIQASVDEDRALVEPLEDALGRIVGEGTRDNAKTPRKSNYTGLSGAYWEQPISGKRKRSSIIDVRREETNKELAEMQRKELQRKEKLEAKKARSSNKADTHVETKSVTPEEVVKAKKARSSNKADKKVETKSVTAEEVVKALRIQYEKNLNEATDESRADLHKTPLVPASDVKKPIAKRSKSVPTPLNAPPARATLNKRAKSATFKVTTVPDKTQGPTISSTPLNAPPAKVTLNKGSKSATFKVTAAPDKPQGPFSLSPLDVLLAKAKESKFATFKATSAPDKPQGPSSSLTPLDALLVKAKEAKSATLKAMAVPNKPQGPSSCLTPLDVLLAKTTPNEGSKSAMLKTAAEPDKPLGPSSSSTPQNAPLTKATLNEGSKSATIKVMAAPDKPQGPFSLSPLDALLAEAKAKEAKSAPFKATAAPDKTQAKRKPTSTKETAMMPRPGIAREPIVISKSSQTANDGIRKLPMVLPIAKSSAESAASGQSMIKCSYNKPSLSSSVSATSMPSVGNGSSSRKFLSAMLRRDYNEPEMGNNATTACAASNAASTDGAGSIVAALMPMVVKEEPLAAEHEKAEKPKAPNSKKTSEAFSMKVLDGSQFHVTCFGDIKWKSMATEGSDGDGVQYGTALRFDGHGILFIKMKPKSHKSVKVPGAAMMCVVTEAEGPIGVQLNGSPRCLSKGDSLYIRKGNGFIIDNYGDSEAIIMAMQF